jgi:hypothetical protein
MPRQDAPLPGGTVPPDQQGPHSVSRRSLLQGAAGAGAAGLAAATLGAAVLGSTATPAQAATTPAQAAGSDPLVVHVRDLRTGDIELFSGTTKTRVRDRDLAARIARASRQGR